MSDVGSTIMHRNEYEPEQHKQEDQYKSIQANLFNSDLKSTVRTIIQNTVFDVVQSSPVNLGDLGFWKFCLTKILCKKLRLQIYCELDPSLFIFFYLNTMP